MLLSLSPPKLIVLFAGWIIKIFTPGVVFGWVWNNSIWDLSVINKSSQLITCAVSHKLLKVKFIVSFVYGCNTGIERRQLWVDLINTSNSVGNMAWAISGDFNVCLDLSEKLGGSISWNSSMEDFKYFVMKLALTDLRFAGELFTWCDGNLTAPKYRKLDRVLVNGHWLNLFDLSSCQFLSRGVSDHSPAVTTLGLSGFEVKRPFQCFNYMCEHTSFLSLVARCWDSNLTGDPWFILTSKLKLVKAALKSLNRREGNVHENVKAARCALSAHQLSMDVPASADQILEEKRLIFEFK